MRFQNRFEYIKQQKVLFRVLWIPTLFMIIFLILHLVDGIIFDNWFSFLLLIPELGLMIFLTKLSIENKYFELTTPTK